MTAAAVLILMAGACGTTAATEGRSAVFSGTAGTPTAHQHLTTPKETGTLHGTLLTTGGPPPGGSRPASGSISVKRGSVVQTKIQVSNGTFTMDLPPGRYAIIAEHNGSPCGPVRVTITAGTATKVQVLCPVP